MALLTVSDLTISFVQYDHGIRRRVIPALHQMSVDVEEGEILTIVGASGSGKSLLAHAILGLLPGNALCEGEVWFEDRLLVGEWLSQTRGHQIRLIPQSVNHLDPSMTIGHFLRLGVTGRSRPATLELLERFGLDPSVYRLYPHELSGGMLRRVLLASCFGEGVRLVVADEPTPGIHPDALAEVLDAFTALRSEGISVALITHDMVSAMGISDRVAVFNQGRILDTFRPAELDDPTSELHPYARRLWAAQPANQFWEVLS